MKLSNRTLQILKNYSVINQSCYFKQGNILSTISPVKTLMAKATLAETFPSSFAIYDLSKFLGVLSLFEEPEIDVEEKALVISKGSQRVQYTLADPSNIVYPEKEARVPDPEITFNLKSKALHSAVKALGVLQLPEIAISGDNADVYIRAVDSKNPLSDDYRESVGSTSHKFDIFFKAENIIKVLPADYDVQITSKGIAHFKGTDIEYWIATEANSKFEK